MSLQVLDAGTARERAVWLEQWEASTDREVSAHPDYARLFARPVDRVICAFWSDAGGRILYPLVRRPLAAEPWALGSSGADLTTPYGYGGPFVEGAPDSWRFWSAFQEWADSEGIVSSFARLSLFPEQLAPFDGEVIERGANVVRSLDLSDEALWMDYEHKVRKNVNKAHRAGLAVEMDPTGVRLDDFIDIYHATMDRRRASASYFFPRSFFEAVIRDLDRQYTFCHVLHEGRVVSTELVLSSARRLYSFLGGTREEAFELRANDLLKHHVIQWGREQEKTHYVLGGGYHAGDGIFRYKLAFAPRGAVPFHVGTKVHDPDKYDALCAARAAYEAASGRSWTADDQYFPAYRGGRVE